MKVFITGATGFIGSAVVEELLAADHQVCGLARSDDAARLLEVAGASVLRGSLDDRHVLQKGGDQSDAVIHCAYNNNFSKIEETSRRETMTIHALGDALAGSSRPFLITSVAAMGIARPGELASEDHFDPDTSNPRKATEIAGAEVAGRGVNVSIIRLPQVHTTERQGLISGLINIAREKKVSAYVGEGQNRWAAVHLSDAAHLFKLVLDHHQPGRYHAVSEEGITLREIAETIGQALKIPVAGIPPEEAQRHFGALTFFAASDMSASSRLTRQRLNWHPSGPGLIEDLRQVQ